MGNCYEIEIFLNEGVCSKKIDSEMNQEWKHQLWHGASAFLIDVGVLCSCS